MKTSTFKASAWALANSVGTRGLSFLFFVFLSRALSPLEMGIMALALSVSFIADTCADAGLSESIIRKDKPDTTFLRAVTTVQVGIGLLFTLLAVILAPLFSLLFKQDLTLVLPAVLVTTVINAIGLCPQALLKKELRFKEITVRNIFGTILGGVVGIAMAHLGCGVWSLVAMNMANGLTGTLICCIATKWLPLPTLKISALSECKKFAMGMTATRVLENSISRADQFIVGSVFNASVLGLYALAVKLYDVLFQVICGPFSDVFFSKLSSLIKNAQEFNASFFKFLKISSLVGPAIFTLSAIFFSLFLTKIFGAQWAGARPYILIILIFGSLQAVAYIHSVALVALGCAGARLKLALTSITLWLLTIVFLVHFGPIMAAVAWASRVTVVVPLQIYMLKQRMNFTWGEYLRSISPGILGVLAALTPYFGYVLWSGGAEFNVYSSAVVFMLSSLLLMVTLLISSSMAREIILILQRKALKLGA